MSYLITKPVKSKGVAALLVMLFGGIGLFYSSILGGIIMGIIAPIVIVIAFYLSLVTGSYFITGLIILFCISYYVICLIWALNAVKNYNYKIIAESNYHDSKKENPTCQACQEKQISDVRIWILFIVFLASLIYILYYKGYISNNKESIKSNSGVISDSTHKQTINTNKIEMVKTKTNEKISFKTYNNKEEMVWKVTAYLIDPSEKGNKAKPQNEEKYFVFDGKKIHEIVNGYLIKTWHINKTYFENEYQIMETKEGDTFSMLGDITIEYKSGQIVEFYCDEIPMKKAMINKEYIED